MCSTVCQTCKCWMGSWNCQRTALHQKPIFCLKYAPYYNVIFCDGTEGIAMFNGINPIDTQVCSLFEWSRSGLSACLGCQRCSKSHDGKPPSVSTSCGKHVFCIIKLYQNLPYTISKLFYGSLQGLFHHEKWGLVHTHRHTLLFMWSSHVHVFTPPITPPSAAYCGYSMQIPYARGPEACDFPILKTSVQMPCVIQAYNTLRNDMPAIGRCGIL